MPHFITDTCIGCTACATMCPTMAITGERQGLHVIWPELCIDCGICGNVCPVECILDAAGAVIPKLKMKNRLKAVVFESMCTGCEFCIDHCPYGAISLSHQQGEEAAEWTPIAVVDEDKCTGCRLCEESCIKNAIVVDLKLDRYNVIINSYGRLEATPSVDYPVGTPTEQVSPH